MEVILSWPKANYINPITRSNGFMVGNFLSLALLTIFMGMYIYSRKFVQKKWTFDNSLCLKAYLCTVALHTTFALGFMNYGWNKHTWDVGIRGAKSKFCTIVSHFAGILTGFKWLSSWSGSPNFSSSAPPA